jgi:uncharacterized membrane protein
VLLITSYYLIDIVLQLWHDKPNQLNNLAAHEWLTRDKQYMDIINFLKTQPEGIVLEKQTTGAYNNTTSLALFSAKPSMLGWASHIEVYHGKQGASAWTTQNEVKAFYEGNKSDALQWLQYNDVKYIVFDTEDYKKENAFNKIQEQIKSRYFWHPLFQGNNLQSGVWVRRD